jgi:hypothetical protein
MAMQAEAPGGQSPPAKRRKAISPFAAAIPIALIGIVATLIGFMPTFFMHLNQVDLPHLLHGWTMIAWLLLILTQATLIRSRHYKWHRRLGWSSIALFAVMFASSCQMIILMLSSKSRLPFDLAKFFAYTDLVDLPLLIILYGGAIVWRKDRHLHARLVSATVLTSIVPALARMFNIMIWRSLDGLFHAMHPTYLLILGILAAAIYVDWRNKRLSWPLPFVFAWFVFDYATLWPVSHMQWYDALARTIGAMGSAV